MLVDELIKLSNKSNEDLIKKITEKLKNEAKKGNNLYYYYDFLDSKTIEYFETQGLEVKFYPDFIQGDFYKFTW